MEHNPSFNYKSPQDMKNFGEKVLPTHEIDIIIEGEKVGAATIEYLSKPLPLYQVSDIYIDEEKQGNKYGRALMERVEGFLKQRKKPGVLVNAIISDEPNLQTMYARRGWVEVPESHGVYVFNWPKDVDVNIMRNYPMRYRDKTDRESYKKLIEED